MWRALVVVGGLVACLASASSQTHSQPNSSPETSAPSRDIEPTHNSQETEPELTDVQLDCRTEQMNVIGQAARAWSLGCNGMNAMPMALITFDLGTGYGYTFAQHYIGTMAVACVCKNAPCPQDKQDELIAELSGMDEFRKQQERKVVYTVTRQLQSNVCLDAALGAKLAQLGFKCASSDEIGIKGDSLHRYMRRIVLAGFKNDPETGKGVAEACWTQATTSGP